MSNLKEKLIVGKYVFEIKEIHKDFTVKSRKLLKVILRKIPIHSITEEDCYNLLNFIHPNVQRVYNYKHDSTFHYFAAEYGSNLKDYLKSENNISIDNRINIVQQSTQGLNYLHNKNIFHGNICLENIFVVGDKVKLANFGPLTDLKQPDEIRHNQTSIMDPFGNNILAKKSDILLLGKTLTNALHDLNLQNNYKIIFIRKTLERMQSNIPSCEVILNDIVFWDNYKVFNFMKSLKRLWGDLQDNLHFMNLIKQKSNLVIRKSGLRWNINAKTKNEEELNLYDVVCWLHKKIKYYEDHLIECFENKHLNNYLEKYPDIILQIYHTTVDIFSSKELRQSFVESELKEIEQFIPREIFLEKCQSKDGNITPEEKELQENMAKNRISGSYLIKSSEIKCTKNLIGKGQFKVYEGYFIRNDQNTKVAIKMVDKAKFKEMKREVYSLCNFHYNNENIIKFYGYYYDDDYYPLVLELAIADVNKFMENRNGVYDEHWKKITKQKILSDTANGVLYLHQNQPSLIHLDLKPENILIVDRHEDGELRACIADFGKSKQAVKAHCVATCSGVVGTRDWYSPEMRELSEIPPTQSAKITIKSDIYQLGLIFGFILINKEFHTKREKVGDGYKIKQRMLMKHRNKKYQKEGLSEFTAEFLILNMIKSDPDKRFDAENVAKNPYFWNEEKIEEFFCQIIKDHKGHSSNKEKSEIINKKARKKVFYGFSWMDIIDSIEVENEKNNSPKARKLDTTSFLDLIDFIIQVKKDENSRYFTKTRAITNATDPSKFWHFWFQKFEFLLVYAYYDVKVISYERTKYYSNLGSIFKTPKRKLITLIKKRNELRIEYSKKIASTCISDERKVSYKIDFSVIQKFMEFLVKNQMIEMEWNFWTTNTESNQAISKRTFDTELDATKIKVLTEKLYFSFLKYNEEIKRHPTSKNVIPRKKKKCRPVRVKINKKSKSLTLEFQREESITL